MRPWNILTKLLLITILALSASGVVSAKVASGPQNLSPGLHQGETVFNPLTHLAKIDFSTTLTPGSPVVPKRGPTIGGGGTLEKLSSSEIKRIQNAANRSGQDVGVVGSRVNPNKPLHSRSDYDYVIDANSKTRNNLSRSLPGSKNVNEGIPSNQDIFKGPIDTNRPYVIFHPE